jgi:hypothetical protein
MLIFFYITFQSSESLTLENPRTRSNQKWREYLYILAPLHFYLILLIEDKLVLGPKYFS